MPATAALVRHCERSEAISCCRSPSTARDCFGAARLAMTAGAWQSCPGGSQARQAVPLLPVGVEIRRVEPALECRALRRPFAVDDREPGGVAVAAAGHRRLPEQSLIPEAETQGGGARGRVQRIAFPFVATIPELIENAPHHQIHRLGSGRPALQARAIGDAADL